MLRGSTTFCVGAVACVDDWRQGSGLGGSRNAETGGGQAASTIVSQSGAVTVWTLYVTLDFAARMHVVSARNHQLFMLLSKVMCEAPRRLGVCGAHVMIFRRPCSCYCSFGITRFQDSDIFVLRTFVPVETIDEYYRCQNRSLIIRANSSFSCPNAFANSPLGMCSDGPPNPLS